MPHCAWPAVVRLYDDESHLPIASGLIIESDGLILTCSHLGLKPDATLTIGLSGGQHVPAVALGRFSQELPDLGLVKIKEKGRWPAVSVDPDLAVVDSEICLAKL
jgi:hypothetical protein